MSENREGKGVKRASSTAAKRGRRRRRQKEQEAAAIDGNPSSAGPTLDQPDRAEKTQRENGQINVANKHTDPISSSDVEGTNDAPASQPTGSDHEVGSDANSFDDAGHKWDSMPSKGFWHGRPGPGRPRGAKGLAAQKENADDLDLLAELKAAISRGGGAAWFDEAIKKYPDRTLTLIERLIRYKEAQEQQEDQGGVMINMPPGHFLGDMLARADQPAAQGEQSPDLPDEAAPVGVQSDAEQWDDFGDDQPAPVQSDAGSSDAEPPDLEARLRGKATGGGGTCYAVTADDGGGDGWRSHNSVSEALDSLRNGGDEGGGSPW